MEIAAGSGLCAGNWMFSLTLYRDGTSDNRRSWRPYTDKV